MHLFDPQVKIKKIEIKKNKKGLKYMTDKNYIDIYTYDLFYVIVPKLEIKKSVTDLNTYSHTD